MKRLLDLLKEQKSADLDAPSTTLEHRQILLRKPFLKKLYEEWYHGFVSELTTLPPGRALELGSGGGFLKDVAPQVLTSDLMPLPFCDLTCSAEALPFADRSLQAIFMINVLHHLPDCRAFFREVERALQPGGLLYIVEPAHTLLARFVFSRLHHEPFDDATPLWEFPTTGPLTGANIALPWIVFHRDLQTFQAEFPNLKVRSIELHTPVRYLLTGGMSFKSPLPGASFGAVTAAERAFGPLRHYLAMFQTIQVERA
jgi:SAM-dependent methyltransferase